MSRSRYVGTVKHLLPPAPAAPELPPQRPAPILTDLRTPPVPGRWYLVPSVWGRWCRQNAWWPVIGSIHHDAGQINFPWLHYHIDGRFLKAAEHRRVKDCGPWSFDAVNAYPLQGKRIAGADVPFDGPNRNMAHRPVLMRRRCRLAEQPWTIAAEKTLRWGLAEKYGDPAPAIVRPDGRLLCPHRKVDLSQRIPDADGNTICPLHGLKVCIRPSARLAA